MEAPRDAVVQRSTQAYGSAKREKPSPRKAPKGFAEIPGECPRLLRFPWSRLAPTYAGYLLSKKELTGFSEKCCYDFSACLWGCFWSVW